jgi:hypothetical protein
MSELGDSGGCRNATNQLILRNYQLPLYYSKINLYLTAQPPLLRHSSNLLDEANCQKLQDLYIKLENKNKKRRIPQGDTSAGIRLFVS